MFGRRRNIFGKRVFHVNIISCGDTGKIIGEGIINSLKELGAKSTSLLINSGTFSDKEKKTFNRTFSIDPSTVGFASRIESARGKAQEHSEELVKELERVVPDNKEDLLIITTGAGATGLGSTLVILDMIYKEHRMVPPVFLLLPEIFENSRIQFNAAQFLYEALYKENARDNKIIILDNKPTIDEMDTSFSEVSKSRLDTIPIGIADLIFGSFKETINERFEANVSDLYDVLHKPGISLFVSQELKTSEDAESARLEAIVTENMIAMTSLSVDMIYQANGAFILVTNAEHENGELNFATEIEADKLYKKFTVTKPFVKFVDDEENPDRSMIYGIIAGVPLPTRILQIMKIAKDARKKVLFREQQLTEEDIEFDIDKITDMEDQIKEFYT